jgi:hypothetical protein
MKPEDVIWFEDMTPDQRQAFADITLHELFRHIDDIVNIVKYLEDLEKKHGIKPNYRFVGKWIEI